MNFTVMDKVIWKRPPSSKKREGIPVEAEVVRVNRAEGKVGIRFRTNDGVEILKYVLAKHVTLKTEGDSQWTRTV